MKDYKNFIASYNPSKNAGVTSSFKISWNWVGDEIRDQSLSIIICTVSEEELMYGYIKRHGSGRSGEIMMPLLDSKSIMMYMWNEISKYYPHYTEYGSRAQEEKRFFKCIPDIMPMGHHMLQNTEVELEPKYKNDLHLIIAVGKDGRDPDFRVIIPNVPNEFTVKTRQTGNLFRRTGIEITLDQSSNGFKYIFLSGRSTRSGDRLYSLLPCTGDEGNKVYLDFATSDIDVNDIHLLPFMKLLSEKLRESTDN